MTFVEPPWRSPLDADACIAAIPKDATITGMFPEGVAQLGRDRGHTIASARARYTPFQAYPLAEHCRILVEVAQKIFPRRSLRESLRRLGRGAPHVLMRSTVGRVVLGSAEGPIATLEAMARSYMLHMRPGTLAVERDSDQSVVIHLDAIYNFLDSHNVGVFEGVLRHAGVESVIRIHSYSPTKADFFCEW